MAASAASSGGLERNIVRLTVHGARKLPAADRGGTSDPYVKLVDTKGLIGDGWKSKTIKKTLDPEWNERLTVYANYKLVELKFKLYDKDTFSSDDLLGICSVDPTTLYDGQEHDLWLPLRGGLTHKAPEAALHISVQIEWHLPVVAPGSWVQMTSATAMVGLGWDFSKKIAAVDLDASIVAMRADNEVVDRVSFDRLSCLNNSIQHLGDNQTGEGDGDDEQIVLRLEQIPAEVEKLCIIVNSYNRKPFSSTKTAYLRVMEGDKGAGKTLAFSRLTRNKADTFGFFFGFLVRHPAGGWWFTMTGNGVEGHTVTGSIPHVVALLKGLVPP